MHHRHITVEQDVRNELFALLASARKTYLRDVIDSGKLYHRFVDDFINSHRYIDYGNVVCRNCHEMIIHIVRGILHDYQDCVRKKFTTESFSLDDCMELKRMYDTSEINSPAFAYDANPMATATSLSFECNFSKEQIEEAQKYCKIEAFQPQYSLADRKDEKLIRWAHEQGLGIMTYGTLGGGILTGNYRKLRTFEQTDSRNRFYPYFKEPLFSKAMELLTIMDQIAEERNVSLAQIAEKWVIQKRFVSSCIIGAQSRARVEENCRNLQWELTDNEIRRLESVRIL